MKCSTYVRDRKVPSNEDWTGHTIRITQDGSRPTEGLLHTLMWSPLVWLPTEDMYGRWVRGKCVIDDSQ